MSAPTLDERIDAMAYEYIEQVIKDKTLTPEAEKELFEKTRNQIVAQRNQAIQTLNEALEELKTLEWHHLVPSSLIDITTAKLKGKPVAQVQMGLMRGLRDIFFIRFGSFCATNKQGWIYRPTSQQMLKEVKRYSKKGVCENIAQQWRSKLKPIQIASDKLPSETEDMKNLKADLESQIKLMLEQV